MGCSRDPSHTWWVNGLFRDLSHTGWDHGLLQRSISQSGSRDYCRYHLTMLRVGPWSVLEIRGVYYNQYNYHKQTKPGAR